LIRGKSFAFRENPQIFGGKVSSRTNDDFGNLSYYEIIYRILKNRASPDKLRPIESLPDFAVW
jgi:hypothetical protein